MHPALCRRRFLATVSAAAAVAVGSKMRADEPDELNQQIDNSIRRAISWLVTEQQASGAWQTRDFGDSIAATSLSIMALMAAGHVPEEGPHGRAITRGVGWVIAQQQDNGLLDIRDRSQGPMYSHGIATLMLAEVCGMVDASQSDQSRTALQKAVKLIIDAQNVDKSNHHAGGWRYNPRSEDSDLSVTGWQLLSLRAAKDIGCDVPSDNIDRAIAYIRRLHVKHDGGFGYQDSNGSSATRAGTGITALEVCGEHRCEETLAAAKYLLRQPLTEREGYFFYGVYYCTVGLYKVGGDEWQQARGPLYRKILEHQNPGGYWILDHGSEKQFGRVYATALSVLALSIEYGYLPIYQR